MPNRILSFAHTSFLLLSALITMLLLTTWELSIPTAQHSALVWIVEDNGSSDSAQVRQTVERVAAEQDIAIGFVAPDVRSPESLWHMYLAVGDPASRYADWLTDGYPSFGRTMELRVHPMEEFADIGPRGFYLIFGPPENEQVLTDALVEHGLTPSIGGTQARLWQSFAGGPLFNVLAIALLVGVTAISAGVLLDSRGYGVQRLQGRSYARILLHDLAQIARLWTIALPAVATVTLVFLGFYNGWNQLGLFTLTALAFVGILTTAALLTHAAVLGLVHVTAILPALKGRIPARTTHVGAYLVRVPVLLLVLTILGSIVHLAQTVQEQRAGLKAFERTGDTSSITLSGSIGLEEGDLTDPLLGPWLRQVDREGRLIISEQGLSEAILPVGDRRPGFDLLVVNDTYLAEQEVLSPSGKRYGAATSDDQIRILLPEAHASYGEDIAQVIPEWLRYQVEGGESRFDIDILPAADDQAVFTYGSRHPLRTETLPFLYEPVIVAFPNGAVLSDGDYVNYMTHDSIVFPEPEVVERARQADPLMAEYVNTVQPIVNKAASDHATRLTLLRIETFNLVAATAVLLMTGIAACIIHVRTQAQTIFARHISGWTFASTHRRFLLLELVVALGFVGWAAWDTLTTLRAMRDSAHAMPPEWTPTTGFEPFYAAGIAVTGLALTFGVLTVLHRRIVREGASQA